MDRDCILFEESPKFLLVPIIAVFSFTLEKLGFRAKALIPFSSKEENNNYSHSIVVDYKVI